MVNSLTPEEQTHTDKVLNAKQFPTVWYGRHMQAGVAEYRPPKEMPYRVLVNETAIREMDASFVGKPVYVQHVDEVDLHNLESEADGYVIRSFFNAADGCHWAEMLITSDAGLKAIKEGWRLSNAYTPTGFALGGQSKGVDYQREVTGGKYDHLALVQDPRYENSIILSPEAFKKFNDEALSTLKRFENSKEKVMAGVFKFFKKAKVEETSLDASPSEILIKLKSGKEVSLETLINAAEAKEEEKPVEAKAEAKPEEKKPEEGAAHKMANEEDHVAVGEGTMSVRELKERHGKMQECMNTLAEMATPKEAKKEEKGLENGDTESPPTPVMSDGITMNDKAEDKPAEAKPVEAAPSFLNALKDAPADARKAAAASPAPFVGVERGKARYGSN